MKESVHSNVGLQPVENGGGGGVQVCNDDNNIIEHEHKRMDERKRYVAISGFTPLCLRQACGN